MVVHYKPVGLLVAEEVASASKESSTCLPPKGGEQVYGSTSLHTPLKLASGLVLGPWLLRNHSWLWNGSNVTDNDFGKLNQRIQIGVSIFEETCNKMRLEMWAKYLHQILSMAVVLFRSSYLMTLNS